VKETYVYATSILCRDPRLRNSYVKDENSKSVPPWIHPCFGSSIFPLRLSSHPEIVSNTYQSQTHTRSSKGVPPRIHPTSFKSIFVSHAPFWLAHLYSERTFTPPTPISRRTPFRAALKTRFCARPWRVHAPGRCARQNGARTLSALKGACTKKVRARVQFQ